MTGKMITLSLSLEAMTSSAFALYVSLRDLEGC